MPSINCRLISLMLFCTLSTLGVALADDERDKKNQGPPPMLVAVAEITTGSAEPLVELTGTVRYSRIARVAGETAGIVAEVKFDDGERVSAGQKLVELNTDLLDTDIAATRATYQQLQLQLELAQKDLTRLTALHKEQAIAEALYDEQRYRTLELKQQVIATRARLDRQLLEKEKAVIRAPFDGLVLEQSAEKGEWVAAATPVATIADDSEIDVIVDVPQSLLQYLQPGRTIPVRAGGRNLTGKYLHFIPRGDVVTRTFQVKIRLKNSVGLADGMEAYAQLPSAPRVDGLLVPRDAVINSYGNDVVFTVKDGNAQMHPVEIRGYAEDKIAVAAPGLTAGLPVIIKGNERVRDGAPVRTAE